MPTHTEITDDDEIVRDEECLRIAGFSRSTRDRQEKQGKFPKRVQISERGVGWKRSQLRFWVRNRPHKKTTVENGGEE